MIIKHLQKPDLRPGLWLKHLKNCLRGFSADQGGAIAVMFALMLPLIIGFAGLGIDAGLWYKDHRSMQTAADAAAVSAAIERTFGATSAEMLSTATTEATRNGFDASADTISVNNPPTSGAFSGDSSYVQVIINHPLSTYLSSAFSSNPTSKTTAVATTTGDSDACVLSLASTGSGGIYMNGAGSTVNMAGCGVVANSDDETQAVHIQNGTFSADCVWAHGGIDGTIATSSDCTKQSGVATVTDPYEDLTVPSYNACDETGGTTASGTVINTGTKVICGNWTFDGTVDLEPGIYIVSCGSITINGGAIVTGDDVTIILSKKTSVDSCTGNNYGKVTINGGANVTLSAVDTDDDPYEGVLFFQDPAAGSSKDFTLNGGSTTELSGAVYVPNNDISFSGGNDTGASGCLMLVAQTVSFSGSADIENDCDLYGGNPINYGATPGLVE